MAAFPSQSQELAQLNCRMMTLAADQSFNRLSLVSQQILCVQSHSKLINLDLIRL